MGTVWLVGSRVRLVYDGRGGPVWSSVVVCGLLVGLGLNPPLFGCVYCIGQLRGHSYIAMASLVNAEYGVIQNRWELIARVSESFLSVLVDKLSSNDLVTFVEHDNTTETARDVVMNILKKVKEDNSVFYKFMSILKDCNQENMVRLLESDLKKDKNKESGE